MKTRLKLLLISMVLLVTHVASATREERLATWLYGTAVKMDHSSAPGETQDEYVARLDLIVRSLAKATMPYANGRGWTATELSLAMLILWNEESRFDKRIHAGLQHPKWTQDNGHARCMGQVHINARLTQEQWEKLAGTDEGSTQLCADATARLWVSQAGQCSVWSGQRADRNKVAKVFAAYGSGGNCNPTEASYARADKWLAMIAKRPDRSPVKGYRRALPSELPPAVVDEAKLIAKRIDPDFNGTWWQSFNSEKAVLGDIYSSSTEEHQEYKYVVEKHADNKIGVSALVKE